MNIFYTLRHEYTNLPEFEDLNGTSKIAFLLALSQIGTLTARVGYCDFRKGDMARDTGITSAIFSRVLKILEDAGYIKCVRPWQRKGNKPGRYVASRYITRSLKVVDDVTQGSRRDQPVKDLNRDLNQEKNVFNNPSSPSDEGWKKLSSAEKYEIYLQNERNRNK